MLTWLDSILFHKMILLQWVDWISNWQIWINSIQATVFLPAAWVLFNSVVSHSNWISRIVVYFVSWKLICGCLFQNVFFSQHQSLKTIQTALTSAFFIEVGSYCRFVKICLHFLYFRLTLPGPLTPFHMINC